MILTREKLLFEFQFCFDTSAPENLTCTDDTFYALSSSLVMFKTYLIQIFIDGTENRLSFKVAEENVQR